MAFEEDRREIDRQWRRLEKERQEFKLRMEVENRRLKEQQSLFDAKLRILEEELRKLSHEKRQMEKQKEFYDRVRDYEYRHIGAEPIQNVVKGEMFFIGVGSRQSLKKRYKDLIKIYHPDNPDGDKNTIQEINREYDYLSKVLG